MTETKIGGKKWQDWCRQDQDNEQFSGHSGWKHWSEIEEEHVGHKCSAGRPEELQEILRRRGQLLYQIPSLNLTHHG